MTQRELTIVDGPDKPALQWSLTKPEGDHDVHFRVEGDAFDAQVLRMDEGADGFTFEISGRLTSGQHKGAPFKAHYSIQSRSGWLRIDARGGASHGQM